MMDRIDSWLRLCPDAAIDPLPGMRKAGLLDPVPDYATIARLKAVLVERTGLLGIGSVWSGRHLVFRHFLGFGTAAQRAEWAARGLAVGISEPDVGAHPKRLTTRADRTDTGFRITGRKAWVSNGPSADGIIVFAITSEVAGRKQYSAFIVPRDTPGLGIGEMPGLHALRPSQHCLLTLDNCPVPAAAMLGEAGSAYGRMALPFRDIEDAVGSFGTLGALRHSISLFSGATLPDQAADLGAIVALTAVFAAAAEPMVAALDAGRFRTGNATLVGLRVLATDIVHRLRTLSTGLHRDALIDMIADLEATLSVARGPRMARQTYLGEAALHTASRAE
ncbi:acyl-CoA dehydrogenase family protein [Rhodopila sp.]|uniref:acyl-CoA dehydrogenase family protein n=1 Tax=Rhodopila sp. TaxID=2480087 RepID=UPI003D097D8F